MSKTLLVAIREFSATVFTKGFLLGIVLTPVMAVIVVGAIAVTQLLKGPTPSGTVAIIDHTGKVGPLVKERFSKEAIDKEVEELKAKAQRAVEAIAGPAATSGQGGMAMSFGQQQLESQMRALESVRVELLPNDADETAAQEQLKSYDAALARDGNEAGKAQRVLVAVIDNGSITANDKNEYAPYRVYTASKLDPEVQSRIESKIDKAIVDARVASDARASAGKLSAEDLRTLLAEPRNESKSVTKEGIKKSSGGLKMLLPMAFMFLLLMSVMTGGQYLLTTTIEEKSSRVMEVLLSAVSPMQLMVGKILGQMCVGLLILTLYSGMGIVSLVVFSLAHELSVMLLVYLFVFFLIAFFVIASMMAAAGSAVSELREAQTLMTPIMMIIMIPWLLWMPISRAPSSMFSMIMSFVPGINPFVMMIRLSSTEPPPTWQVIVSIIIGLATAVACGWGAAKIFRVGVLMYGKPPNWRTLIRWVRMA